MMYQTFRKAAGIGHLFQNVGSVSFQIPFRQTVIRKKQIRQFLDRLFIGWIQDLIKIDIGQLRKQQRIDFIERILEKGDIPSPCQIIKHIHGILILTYRCIPINGVI